MSDISRLLEVYREDYPVDIENLIANVGLFLDPEADLPAGISGHIKCEDGAYVIRANRNEHIYRRRFTMAHELGHFVLHRSILDRAGGVNDSTMYRTEKSAPLYNMHIQPIHEQQANSFAANLLMPTELVKEVWNAEAENEQGPPTLTEMHRAFHVSPSAMRWRLKNLGLQFVE